MKIYILEDYEGISGIGCPKICCNESDLLHSEINAVIDGARKGGATEIVVGDWHNMGGNLSSLKLSQPVRLTQWADKGILKEEKFDMAFFVGAHARAGLNAIMAHTEEYFIENVFIDGKPVGETTLVFCYLNDLGIPVGGIIGAGEALDEVRNIVHGTELVEVKRGFDCLPVEKTREMIRKMVEEAVQTQKAQLVPSQKREFLVEYSSSHFAVRQSSHAKVSQKNNQTIQIHGQTIGECYAILMELLS